ncbi:MAG: mitochondrial fission ELM1 family protein, partial [Rickettsiales bacterium]|nr:mitochondrial fission ELM1 family protein [Rickettsiales bacterium]
KTGGSVFISTSRRTSPEALKTLQEELARQLPPETKVYTYDYAANDGKNNPYLDMMRMDKIVVTSDSMSMMADAVATGREVYIADRKPTQSTDETTRARTELLNEYAGNIKKSFGAGTLGDPANPPDPRRSGNAASQIAGRIGSTTEMPINPQRLPNTPTADEIRRRAKQIQQFRQIIANQPWKEETIDGRKFLTLQDTQPANLEEALRRNGLEFEKTDKGIRISQDLERLESIIKANGKGVPGGFWHGQRPGFSVAGNTLGLKGGIDALLTKNENMPDTLRYLVGGTQLGAAGTGLGADLAAKRARDLGDLSAANSASKWAIRSAGVATALQLPADITQAVGSFRKGEICEGSLHASG